MLSFGRKIVVFVIAIQRYLCNSTFCKSLLSCGDAVVLLVAGKRWLSQPDQESKRSYWEEPCHILVSFLCPSLPYNTLISFFLCPFASQLLYNTEKEIVMDSSWNVIRFLLYVSGFTDSLPPDEEAFASKACGKNIFQIR